MNLPLPARVLLCFLVLLLALPALAQRPNGARPAIGRIYGRVLDATTKKGVEFATVQVTARDSIVGGGLVETNGDFNVEHLPLGQLKVKVAFMGYTTLE